MVIGQGDPRFPEPGAAPRFTAALGWSEARYVVIGWPRRVLVSVLCPLTAPSHDDTKPSSRWKVKGGTPHLDEHHADDDDFNDDATCPSADWTSQTRAPAFRMSQGKSASTRGRRCHPAPDA